MGGEWIELSQIEKKREVFLLLLSRKRVYSANREKSGLILFRRGGGRKTEGERGEEAFA